MTLKAIVGRRAGLRAQRQSVPGSPSVAPIALQVHVDKFGAHQAHNFPRLHLRPHNQTLDPTAGRQRPWPRRRPALRVLRRRSPDRSPPSRRCPVQSAKVDCEHAWGSIRAPIRAAPRQAVPECHRPRCARQGDSCPGTPGVGAGLNLSSFSRSERVFSS